jgi:hypothetical protein
MGVSNCFFENILGMKEEAVPVLGNLQREFRYAK